MSVLIFILLAFLPILMDFCTRKEGPESLTRAATWSLIYVMSASMFAAYLLFAEGAERSTLFLSAYVIEKAMSMDNLIIFGAIFTYFGVRPEHQHRVLHCGIIGSAVLRFAFIAVGLVAFFVFGRLLDLAFGAFVIFTAWKMSADSEGGDIDHSSRWYVRLTRRFFPVTPEMDGRFFVGIAATPLFFCLIALEITDIAFAFDSVPAVLGLTRDTLIAYSAVMFAVVGLRSMYFVLEAMRRYTASLAKAVMGILYFVGSKMMIHGLFGMDIPPAWTLAVIAACLLLGIGAGIFAGQAKATAKV